MFKQRGFIGSPYVLVAVAVVVSGLSLACYALYQRAEAAKGEAKAARGERDRAIQAVKEAEETIEVLQVAARVLDAQLTKIHARESELQREKRRLKDELDALAKTLSAEDQACLDRPLPDAIAERLLNDRAANHDKGREAASTGRPAGSVR